MCDIAKAGQRPVIEGSVLGSQVFGQASMEGCVEAIATGCPNKRPLVTLIVVLKAPLIVVVMVFLGHP